MVLSMGYDPPRPGLSHAGAPLPGGDFGECCLEYAMKMKVPSLEGTKGWVSNPAPLPQGRPFSFYRTTVSRLLPSPPASSSFFLLIQEKGLQKEGCRSNAAGAGRA